MLNVNLFNLNQTFVWLRWWKRRFTFKEIDLPHVSQAKGRSPVWHGFNWSFVTCGCWDDLSWWTFSDRIHVVSHQCMQAYMIRKVFPACEPALSVCRRTSNDLFLWRLLYNKSLLEGSMSLVLSHVIDEVFLSCKRFDDVEMCASICEVEILSSKSLLTNSTCNGLSAFATFQDCNIGEHIKTNVTGEHRSTICIFPSLWGSESCSGLWGLKVGTL